MVIRSRSEKCEREILGSLLVDSSVLELMIRCDVRVLPPKFAARVIEWRYSCMKASLNRSVEALCRIRRWDCELDAAQPPEGLYVWSGQMPLRGRRTGLPRANDETFLYSLKHTMSMFAVFPSDNGHL